MNKKLLGLYGLKWDPFTPDVPLEALLATPKIESFCWRIENALVRDGGFALITGDPGQGKSVAMRILHGRLQRLSDVTVGVLEHPQSSILDFYREMGELFGVPLRPHNRWCGFKALRERWLAHIESTTVRPVLLVDEAQEMRAQVLSELRILTSTQFDSRTILTAVLSGDGRLLDMLRRDDLVPLGSRMRVRLTMDHVGHEDLMACLRQLLVTAGNASLMTPELMRALCDHACGNYRILIQMAGTLLAAAAEKEAPRLDEKLYLEVFDEQARAARPVNRQKTARAR